MTFGFSQVDNKHLSFYIIGNIQKMQKDLYAHYVASLCILAAWSQQSMMRHNAIYFAVYMDTNFQWILIGSMFHLCTS